MHDPYQKKIRRLSKAATIFHRSLARWAACSSEKNLGFETTFRGKRVRWWYFGPPIGPSLKRVPLSGQIPALTPILLERAKKLAMQIGPWPDLHPHAEMERVSFSGHSRRKIGTIVGVVGAGKSGHGPICGPPSLGGSLANEVAPKKSPTRFGQTHSHTFGHTGAVATSRGPISPFSNGHFGPKPTLVTKYRNFALSAVSKPLISFLAWLVVYNTSFLTLNQC